MIKIFSRSNYKINKKKIINQINSHLKKLGDEKILINIIFVGRRKMRQIAKKYKGEETAFPVLSFSYKENQNFLPSSTNDQPMGEIFICYPQAVLLAADLEKEVDTVIIELIKHGIGNIL